MFYAKIPDIGLACGGKGILADFHKKKRVVNFMG
jgi:hypothetical protein